jgi:phospholipase C
MREGRAVAGLTGSEWNPAPDGSMVQVFRLDDFTVADPPHEWDACHQQWNGGANDGFVRANAGSDQAVVMGYHVREQIPAMYALADGYALCDHWFASVMGPTWPNRFYLHGASSNGIQTNLPTIGFPNVFSQLAQAGISARNYFHDVAWSTGGYFKLDGLATIEQFFDDAAAGTLPQFSIIDPAYAGGGANDDHPDHDVRRGQALIASVHNALARSPQWGRCLFVLTYDEHGGFYDHVPPPTTVDGREDFRQLGFRVPSIVAGPFVARGCAVSRQLDHVSVLATVSKRFALPPLNDRVAATTDLSVCIDPAFLSDPQPPVELPPVELPRRPPPRRALDGTLRPLPRAQCELSALADRGIIPRHLDRRAEGEAIAERVLAWGRTLGAVR